MKRPSPSSPRLFRSDARVAHPPGNYVGEREIRFGQWSPDYTLRLFNRATAQFNLHAVHESVETSGEVLTLRARCTTTATPISPTS